MMELDVETVGRVDVWSTTSFVMDEIEANSSDKGATLRMGESFFYDDESAVPIQSQTETAVPSLKCIHCHEVFKCDSALYHHVKFDCAVDPLQTPGRTSATEEKRLIRYVPTQTKETSQKYLLIRGPESIHDWQQWDKTAKPFHRIVRKFRCNLCPVTCWDKQSFRRHMKVVHTTPIGWLICSGCNKSLCSKKSLVQHIKYECGKKGQFQCFYCLRQIKSEKVLWIHLSSEHKRLVAGHKMPSGRRLECPACHHYFPNKIALSHHMRNECGKDLWSPQCYSIQTEITPHTNLVTGPYICPQCRVPFISSIFLNRHVAFCRKLKIFQCFHCSRKFMTKYHLQYHIFLVHDKLFAGGPVKSIESKVPPTLNIEYTDCLEVSSTPSENRISHLRFECTKCHKFFNDKSLLSQHLLVCGKGRLHTVRQSLTRNPKSTSSQLKCRTYFIEQSKGAFVCARCGVSYSTQYHMNQHLTVCWTEFKCSRCPSKFTTLHQLRHHLQHHREFDVGPVGRPEPLEVTSISSENDTH